MSHLLCKFNPLSANPTQSSQTRANNLSAVAEKLLECIWPFYVGLALKGLIFERNMASKTNSSNFVFYFYLFLFSYTNTIDIAEVCLFSSISNTDICQCTDAALHAAYTRA